ncbi:hypothetical protein [Desulfocurvibacter africanus]|uniref:Lipoprotein n=1 Tax=Desulfocurvibacter africanus subsp. africanus str. Walvis Bay TaxID=690850 RepID=F3YYR5_DESAF|nr:hypothetical protein [Desulfocurvibacter africanus]EGJ51891.1 hypothetical protein Desaf_3613 [Desulfocurvibacter africanus subsp. africanus str. Walvis Bay]
MRLFAVMCMCLFLSGCASMFMGKEVKLADGSVFKIRQSGGGSDSKFRSYALLEKTDSGWEVVALNRRYLERSKPNQEVLGIDAATFGPVYPMGNPSDYELCYLYCLRGKQMAYQPCNSKFYSLETTTSNATVASITAAWSLGTCPQYMVVLDRATIQEAVNESKVLEKERAFHATLLDIGRKVEDFKEHVVIHSRIVNNTGLEEARLPKLGFAIESTPLDSQLTLAEISFQIRPKVDDTIRRHDIDVPGEAEFTYDPDGLVYEPTVVYNKFFISALSYPDSFWNRDVGFSVLSISRHSASELTYRTRISNYTKSPVQVYGIDIHFEDEVASYAPDNLMIPPDAYREISFTLPARYGSPLDALLGSHVDAASSKRNYRIGIGLNYRGTSAQQLSASDTCPLARLAR